MVAEMFDIQGMIDALTPIALAYLSTVLLAVVTLFVGLKIIGMMMRALGGMLDKNDVDATLKPFLISISGTGLKVLLVISVASTLGVEMTSFVAVIAAAGLAVGLALQGSLSNFAGGVLILIFKPFTVGDVIEAQGYTGKVDQVQIFATIMKTPDNKTIIIPNGQLSNGSIINYSSEATRRVDLTFGIGYGDDIEKARSAIKGLVAVDQRILKDPEPFIRVGQLADSSVNFFVRIWVAGADYWAVFFDMTENVKKEFDQQGIGMPYPQMDVHLKKE